MTKGAVRGEQESGAFVGGGSWRITEGQRRIMGFEGHGVMMGQNESTEPL